MILTQNNLLSNKKNQIISNVNTYSVGDIIIFAGKNIPLNYLLCDGTLLDKDIYILLYNKIGTTWGSLSGNSFPLPDLRGRFLRGTDKGQSRDSRIDLRTGGDAVGSILATSITGLPTSSFTGTPSSSGEHAHNVQGTDRSLNTSSLDKEVHRFNGATSSAYTTTSAFTHSHTISLLGGDIESVPKSKYLEFIIKYI